MGDIRLVVQNRDTSVLPSVCSLLELNLLSCDTLVSICVVLSDTTYRAADKSLA